MEPAFHVGCVNLHEQLAQKRSHLFSAALGSRRAAIETTVGETEKMEPKRLSMYS
jgi:hypothetical protein